MCLSRKQMGSRIENLNALTSSRSFDVEKRSNPRISLFFCIYLKRLEVEIETVNGYP